MKNWRRSMKNKLLMIVAVLAIMGGGVYLGMQPSDEKKKRSEKEAQIKKVGDRKSVTDTSQDPKKKEEEEGPSPATSQTASSSGKYPDIQNKKDIYNNDEYWGKIKKDPQIIRLYNKTLGLFKKSAEGEDLAVWIASGLIFDQSAEYGALLGKALKEIDNNKDENFNKIKKTLGGLSPEDSFIRGMAINLVNQLSLSSEDKVSFFGQESSRKVLLDEKGRFSPDSLNITTSMIFMKQNIKSPSDALSYATESLKKNTDPVIRNKLITRFKAYFPDISKDLEQYK
jgi:hypothetical protein